MPQNERAYIAIDLKSYYASVECMERGLDPMQTNLVVADPSRTEKTICLAVSPALKAYGIPGRARLFEVVERVRQVNAERQRRAPGGRLTGKSADDLTLKADASLAVDYLVASPRMAKYIEVSMQIYGIWSQVFSPEDGSATYPSRDGRHLSGLPHDHRFASDVSICDPRRKAYHAFCD